MGFNFMAALGGAADQITKDIEAQENEVKLRTRTILDRHVAETAANRKEYKANKKKVQEQLNSIVAYFGNDPDRWNKARAIVAGGDAHVAKMSQYFAKAQDNKQDINEIYKFTKSENDIGLKGIEDTTNSLVQMAQIAQPSFGKKGETESAFGLDMGTTMYRNMYAKARKQYVESGLLDAIPTAIEPGGTYGTGTLDLSKVNTDAKSVDQQKANILRDLTQYKVGTPEHTKALEKQATLNEFEESNSLALKIAKEQNKTKGQATRSFYQTTLKNGLAGIENRFKQDIVTGDDGKIITDLEKKEEFKKQKISQYKTDFVNNLIRNPGGLSSNGLEVIQSDPELNDIYNNIMDEEQEKISGGKKGDKKESKKEESFFEQQEKILKEKKRKETLDKKRSEFKAKFGDNIDKAAADLFGRKGIKKLDVFNTLKNVYPDKSDKELYDIVTKAETDMQVAKKDKVIEDKKNKAGTIESIYKGGADQLVQKEINRGG
tara:strand:- start:1740 stop:3209 length:1470 start_codon:yes stop_codon:yes gene_type:complete